MTSDVIAAASAVAASPAAVAADAVGILNADFATAGAVFADVVSLTLAFVIYWVQGPVPGPGSQPI